MASYLIHQQVLVDVMLHIRKDAMLHIWVDPNLRMLDDLHIVGRQTMDSEYQALDNLVMQDSELELDQLSMEDLYIILLTNSFSVLNAVFLLKLWVLNGF